MKKFFLTLLVGAGCWSAAHATEYYVSSGANSVVTGVDVLGGGRGLSAALPFRTIQYAADQTQPGDVVYVRQGTYTNVSGVPVVQINTPGTASQWITYRNYPNERPLLQFNAFQGFLLKGRVVNSVLRTPAYIVINGFRIQGNNRNLNNPDGTVSTTAVAAAANQPSGCTDPNGAPQGQYNGNGISADGSATVGYPHHLRFVNNEVFDCGGVGIGTNQSDYVTIENNLVYNNSWYTRYGTSGITINSSRNFGNDVTNYRIIIQNNRCFGNRLYVKWYSDQSSSCKGITDGNGIILDVNRSGYTGRFLVANNLCVNNGGAGVQVFKTDNVDVINNTLYANSRSPELRTVRGEVYLNDTKNVLVQNNIMVTNASAKASGVTASTNYTYANNLYFGSTQIDVLGTMAVQADPQFVAPGTNVRTADFRLRPTAAGGLPASPAIAKGVNNRLSTFDLAYGTRLVGTKVDIGAYEVQTSSLRPAGTALSTTSPASTGAQLEAYPNPFSGAATLTYALAQPGPVRLEVFDLLGRCVALLVNEAQPAGRHEARFAAPGQGGELYQVRLTTAQGSTTQKLSRHP